MSGTPGAYGPADAYRADSAAYERTALAWQRTALALLVAAALIARLTVGELGPAAIVGGALAATGASALLVAGRFGRQRGLGGLPHLVTAALVCVVAGLELVAIVRG